MQKRIITASLICLTVFVHGQSIMNSKHDLSAISTGATIKAETEQGVCIFCHTPHSPGPADQLWNREPTAASYSLYTSTRLTAAGYPTPSQPNEKSKLCMSCHDGTIALGAVYNMPGSGGGGTITMASGVTTMPGAAAGYIGINLADDHPIGFTYDVGIDPDLIDRSWPWPGPVLLDPNSSSGTVECHTCHNPHDNTNSPFLVMDKASLCIECHSKTGWTGSAHSASVGCGGCHIPHGGGTSLLGGVEEAVCYSSGCHGTVSSSPVTGSNGRVLNIEDQAANTNSHPINTISGIHQPGESTGSDYASPSNRHAECFDCHDPHQAGGSTSGIATALKGTWGVRPNFNASDLTAIMPHPDNSNIFVPPSSYTVVDPAVDEYQLCLKCHSDYTTQITQQRNIAEEINPFYRSTHGLFNRAEVTGAEPRNPYVMASNMEEPWASNINRQLLCSDCHAASAVPGGIESRSDAKGPHGSSEAVGSPDPYSNQASMLVATIASSQATGTPLCLVCHRTTEYWDGPTVNGNSRMTRHPPDRSGHDTDRGCFACHMYEYNDQEAYSTGVSGGNSKRILVHGQNKYYIYAETDPLVPGSYADVPVDAFVNGYIAQMNFVGTSCWSDDDPWDWDKKTSIDTEQMNNCGEGHSDKGY